MKIYVVTSGSYSDYGIEAVYADRDMAYAYANLDSDRTVEEYDSDTVKVEQKPLYARINYIPGGNYIEYISTNIYHTYSPDPDRYEKKFDCFTFYCCLSDRTRKDIEKNGKDSQLLLKAAQDRWYKYTYEHIYDPEPEQRPKPSDTVIASDGKIYRITFANSSSGGD